VRTVALYNLGCSKNQIDGENILGRLCDSGFTAVSDFSRAETIIVNTCAFIKEAQQEAIEAILDMARYKAEGCCATLVVSGCFSERFRTEARIQFPEVDAWLGVHDWPVLLSSMLHAGARKSRRVLFPPYATQYLKVAEGCSRKCSFCAIPGIRGPFVSRPQRDILDEAKWLSSKGVRECILVSQDTTSYGKDGGGSLVSLLEKILAATDFPWIRLMYLHPQLVSPELLDLFASEKRLAPYFDIPLQHINDDILRSMNRRPLSAGIRKIVTRIRKSVPHAAVRTTFIVGYPGETSRHFYELLDFIEESKFERLGVFPYSPEEGTKAFALAKRVSNAVANSRCEEIMSLQREISASRCASLVGSTVDVIIDGPSEDDMGRPDTGKTGKGGTILAGRTVWDAPEVDGTVFMPGGGARVGSIVPVTIVSAEDYDLTAILATKR
jgi:ribosomal protein S12 methylthiotransferase